MDKSISICILAFNKYPFTKSCLDDLSKLPNTVEIVVVNNGTDETHEKLKDSKEIVYYKSNENGGFAKGSNIAYSLSTAPNVMFLNNDIRVKDNHSNWVDAIITKCSNAIVGPTMGELDNNFNFIREANTKLNSKYSYMSGWCISSSKEIWKKLEISTSGVLTTDCHVPQLFSHEFGLAYFEDTDLSFRARQQNIPFEVVPIPVVHFGKVSSKQINTLELYTKAKKIFTNKWRGRI